MVDYGLAIRKPFTDIKKLLIGTILSMIPIIHWFAKGFYLRSSAVKIKQNPPDMPEWDNWAELWITGLLASIIAVIYAIPAALVFLLGASMTVAALLAHYMATVLPPELLREVAAGTESPEIIQQIIIQDWQGALPVLIQAGPIMLVVLALGILAAYAFPIGILNYIKSSKFGDAFKFRQLFKKALNIDYFVVWTAVVIITAIIGWVLHFIPFVGIGLSFFMTGVISYSLFGQIYKKI